MTANNALASMKAQRCTALRNMKNSLEHAKVAYIGETKHDSQAARKRREYFDSELARLGLMPVASTMDRMGISIFEYYLREFRDPVRAHTEDTSMIDDSRGAMLGLCLLCTKEGNFSASPDSLSAAERPANGGETRAVGKKRKRKDTSTEMHRSSHSWRKRRLWRLAEDEEVISDVVGSSNCMASTGREHHRYKG